MLLDASVDFTAASISAQAQKAESDGFDGVWASETNHEPFLTLAGAASSTSRVELGTGIVVAFGRSPMLTALMANDLQLLSQGRLILGLGSQIKPHIEKRYSMPWSHPAARMREYVMALRAIWSSWHEGSALNFEGDFYTHTLMTPYFNPGPNEYGAPKVFLAAVGELMTEVAGEVADGLMLHSFTTDRYVRDVTLPALERGFHRTGKSREDMQVSMTVLVATGTTDSEFERSTRRARSSIAFYGSTPAYRGVLAHHGWGDLYEELHTLSKSGEWSTMTDLIDDEVLNAFAIVGHVDELADKISERFGSYVDRLAFHTMHRLEPEVIVSVIDSLRQRSTN